MNAESEPGRDDENIIRAIIDYIKIEQEGSLLDEATLEFIDTHPPGELAQILGNAGLRVNTENIHEVRRYAQICDLAKSKREKVEFPDEEEFSPMHDTTLQRQIEDIENRVNRTLPKTEDTE